MSTLWTGFLLVFALSFTASAKPVANSQNDAQGRDSVDGFLPRVVAPTHYDLELLINIYEQQPPFTFSGTGVIYINCTVRTNLIFLNSRGLRIIGVRITNDPNNAVRPPSPILLQWSLDPQADFLILEVANPLEVGFSYVIDVYFDGVLNSNGNGLHWRSYVEDDGTTKYLAVTQFQSIAARQMFPCLDEPDLKATFNITILSRPPSITLSNMPVYRTENRADGWVAYIFAESPIMSTYQVTIAIGEFVAVEADWRNVTSYPVTLYARRQVADKLAISARYAARIQAWFEVETGIPYPLPKIDHILIPDQTWAMENWGLITYGENWLAIGSETAGANSVVSATTVLGHEIAHQWFGNLITFRNFNDAWLHEGFAQHYEFYAMEAIGWPTSEFQQADNGGSQQFLDVDQVNTSVPIIKKLDNIWQADVMSVGSTYPKGAAIVRHLRGILTPQTFRRGITNYLNKHAYGAVTNDDLWNALNAQAAADGVTNPDGSPIDTGAAANAWLYQFGYPLLTVTRNGDGTAAVTSRQFFNPTGQTAEAPSDYNYSWSIPITIGTRTTTNWDEPPKFWIPFGETSTTLTGLPTGSNDWFLINVKQLFFYRVNYDTSLLNDIASQLQTDFTAIPVESRSQLIDDAFTLSRTLDIPVTPAMNLTVYLDRELTYNAWKVALKHLTYIDNFLRSFLWYPNFRSYVVSKLLPVHEQLGWEYTEGEYPLLQLLRRSVNLNLCYLGFSECLTYAQQLYDQYKANPSTSQISYNSLSTALCKGVNGGDASDWSFVFEQYLLRKSSPISEERNAFLYGLSCTSDYVWQERYLSYIIRGELIDARDQNAALSYMNSNSLGRGVVWTYLDNSWNTVPAGINKVARLEEIARTYSSVDESTQFNNFIGKYPPTSESEFNAFRRIDQIIVQNIGWRDSNHDDLRDWLSAQPSPSSHGTAVQLMPGLPSIFTSFDDSFISPKKMY